MCIRDSCCILSSRNCCLGCVTEHLGRKQNIRTSSSNEQNLQLMMTTLFKYNQYHHSHLLFHNLSWVLAYKILLHLSLFFTPASHFLIFRLSMSSTWSFNLILSHPVGSRACGKTLLWQLCFLHYFCMPGPPETIYILINLIMSGCL